jgi:hypothetical protein
MKYKRIKRNIPKRDEIFQNEMKDFKFKSKIIEKLMNIHNQYSHREKQEIQQFGYFQIYILNEEEF